MENRSDAGDGASSGSPSDRQRRRCCVLQPGAKGQKTPHFLRRSNGVSLVEVMAGIIVFGILIAACLPAFRKYMSTQLVEGAVSRFAVNLRLARQKAATEGNNYLVSFDPATNTYQILDDDNNNSTADAVEIVHGPITIPAELTVTSGPTGPFPGGALVFYPNGTASTTGQLTISNARGFSRLLSVVRSTGAVAIR